MFFAEILMADMHDDSANLLVAISMQFGVYVKLSELDFRLSAS
jgi:hypothetical protein